MLSFSITSVVAALLATQYSQYAHGLPELVRLAAATCDPTIFTTSNVNTVESIVTIPYSCYTYTVETAQHTNCPTLSCGHIAECILESTTTIFVPPSTACCPITTTATTQGPCPTCQKGCATALKTATVTTLASGSGATNVKRDDASTSTQCTYTIFIGEPLLAGPTKTEYPNTITKTIFEDCEGCGSIDVRNIDGLGPVVKFTTTTWDWKPTTTTTYACSKTW